ncbi:MAG: cation:proton antiporter, partial [Litorivicinus sp.]
MVNTLLFLGAAVIVVPLSRLLKLGTVLGYLIAGLCLGPYGLGVFKEAEGILHFAELGVVLLLFLIGLELEGPRLSQTRAAMLRFGLPQLVVTTALVALVSVGFGASWSLALVIGLGLALSSTAFALQLLGERREFSAPHGQGGFAVLLTQDIAVIPILAMLPFLGGGQPDTPVWVSIA